VKASRARAAGAALLAGLVLAASGARAHEGGDDASHHAGEGGSSNGARFEAPAPGSYQLPPFGQIEPHTVLGSDGLPAPLLDAPAGGAALVSFVYLSCPDACPAATAVLQRVDRKVAGDPRLAGRVTLATVSFDPVRDTPAKMAEFRGRVAPRGRWRFLTAASAADLGPVLDDFGQDGLAHGEGATPVTHTLKVFLLDGAGRVRNVYSSGFLDDRVVVNDLLTVLGG
jgi:cytochrome oxidase Cu insertion factor (SCO1/SenC/PrrC family)